MVCLGESTDPPPDPAQQAADPPPRRKDTMLQVIALGCLAALLLVWRLAHMATDRKRRDTEIAERLRRYARG